MTPANVYQAVRGNGRAPPNICHCIPLPKVLPLAARAMAADTLVPLLVVTSELVVPHLQSCLTGASGHVVYASPPLPLPLLLPVPRHKPQQGFGLGGLCAVSGLTSPALCFDRSVGPGLLLPLR